MHSVRSEHLKSSSSALEEDLLVKKIVLSHDPDGRHIDSETLLRAMENVMCYATTPNVSQKHLEAMEMDNLYNIEAVGSQEALGNTIYKISCEILCKCSGNGDLHARTMTLFDLLGYYSWDAKVVLVLAAFATCYGEFWLIIQLYPLNPLAVSVAMLKQLPKNLDAFKPRFRALSLLVKTMVDVTKCIVEFEGLPSKDIKLDDKIMGSTKFQIYIAAYWVIRSALTCSSLITDLIAMNHEQVNSTSTTNATWELSSLVYKMSGIHSQLRKQVDMCHLQMEEKVYQKLLHLFDAAHNDNHEVLHTLFALKDDMPFKDGSSQAKLGVSELVEKEVIVLVSKPEILPLQDLLFLVQQTYDHPHQNELKRSYEIVWVPIPSSTTWTDIELKVFNHLSNTLPWYSIRQPWLLNAAVANYIKKEWRFVDEPLMVVLDSHGRVTSPNAIDMVLIWGSMAYPFSNSREEQLWEEANWNLQLIIDEIDSLMSMWVEEGRTLCLYGSEDLEWIREFTGSVKEITNSGVQIELVYVGNRNPGELVRNILGTIAQENLSGSLSYLKIHFFWLRLESMRRSKIRLGKSTTDADHILKELVSLMSSLDSSRTGWVMIGQGSSSSTDIVRLQGRKLEECLKLFQVWGENVEKVGFLGAIRSALEPLILVDPCSSCSVVPYDGSTEGTVVCEECKRPMKKYIFYQCQVTE